MEVEPVAEDIVDDETSAFFDEETDDDEDELDLYRSEEDESADLEELVTTEEEQEEDEDDTDRPERRRKKERRQEEKPEPEKKREGAQKEEPRGSEPEGPAGRREPNPLERAESSPKISPEEAGKIGRAGETAGQVSKAGEGAAEAVGEASQAAGGAVKAAGGAVRAAGGAARVAGGLAEAGAGVAEAAEAGAVVAGTSEVWGPILIGAVLVFLTVAVCIAIYGIARWAWRGFNLGNWFGTTGTVAESGADFAWSFGKTGINASTIIKGAKFGYQVDKAVVDYLREKISGASKEATKINPDSKEAVKLQNHIQEADSALTYLSQSAGSDRVEYYNQAQQLFYHLDRIDATLLGVSAESPDQLVAKAAAATSLAWVRTTNDDDPAQPLRDGSNVVNNQRGCDAAGFVTYVLRDPEIPCSECTSPNIEDIPEVFQSALEAVDTGDQFSTDKLAAGDVVLTKKDGADDNGNFQTLYGGFVYLGKDSGFAYCGQNKIGNLPTNDITSGRSITNVLRLKTPPR